MDEQGRSVRLPHRGGSLRIGLVITQKDGRQNRYQVEAHVPLGNTIGPERSIGEALDLRPTLSRPQCCQAGQSKHPQRSLPISCHAVVT